MPILPKDRNLEQSTEPLVTDVDSGITAIHHTLGPAAFQASPGSHRHDGSDSHKIKLSDLDRASDVTYVPLGGTDGTQPTFSGDPLITGSYTVFGNLCHFQIDVDFDNVTSFGSGQYYLTLPFPSTHAFLVRDGCLHDISHGNQYAISGHVDPGSDILQLFSVTSNGRDVPFTHHVPVNLAVADNLHIAGVYHVQL